MGKWLSITDRMIDVNAIVFEKCLDTVTRIVSNQGVPQLYGQEQNLAASDGVLLAASNLYCRVHDMLLEDGIDEEEFLAEYVAEREEEKRLALEERKSAAEAQTKVSVTGVEPRRMP